MSMSMSNQPLCRSPRLAEEVDAKKSKANASKPKSTPSSSSSSATTTRGRSVTTAKTTNGSAAVKSSASSSRRSSSTSRSRSPRAKAKLCSLQSLESQLPLRRSTRRSNSTEWKCQETPKQSSGSRADTITRTPNTPYSNKNRCVVVSPATIQSKQQRQQSSTVSSSKGVKFNLARNSFVEYFEENPPSSMIHLIREFDESDDDDGNDAIREGSFDDESAGGGGTTKRGRRMTIYDSKHRIRSLHAIVNEDDDDVTLRNEMILAEWESHFGRKA